MLWNREGKLSLKEDILIGELPNRKIQVFATKESIIESSIPCQTPYLTVVLNETVGISTGKARTIEEIKEIIQYNSPMYDGVPFDKERHIM